MREKISRGYPIITSKSLNWAPTCSIVSAILYIHCPLMRARTSNGCPITTIKSLNDEIGLQFVEKIT
jgi:hypothetical protein